MKKKLFLLIACILLCTGCGNANNEVDEPQFVEKVEIVHSTECVVNDDSTIADDFEIFNMEMNVQNDDLALADLIVMFPTEEDCYMYFNMPADQEEYIYRVKDIIINDIVCSLELTNINGYYQKYKIEDFAKVPSENNLYHITTIHFYNKKNENDNQTYNIVQNITAVFDEEKFYFEQEYLYNITLQGQLFESVYQFNKENNQLVDLWCKIVGNVERLDEDRRSFFYFAFKCYDIERDIHFVPEDILQLDVEYTRLSYEYQGKDKEAANNIVPERKTITDQIKPDSRYITSTDERSNKCAYEYDTINRLSEADLSKNVGKSNAKVLEQAAKQYDWAVQFGTSGGYPHKSNEAGLLWGHEYDINYTQIEDFKTIYIKYRYEGKTISTGTNSLIREVTTEVIEQIPEKPSASEELEYDLRSIWQNDNLTIAEKITQSGYEFIMILLPVIILALIVVLIFKFRKSKYRNYVDRCVEKIMNEVFDDED